ncbi:uncharacterized protein LOC131880461 [Tigriopus californicus]|uniref:uncharacterized protein LOC131880461 n=1 Tax=Tigriopus californicus TaxID=6832 RepID=UPI0027DA87EE|nr:uncharacterized protein LOC131880461 [Tigriopus californicus]
MNYLFLCLWLTIFLLIVHEKHAQGSRQWKSKDVNFNTLGQKDNVTNSRENRLFSLFSIVQFKNSPCSSTLSFQSGGTSSVRRNGTCYTTSECLSRSGSSFGSCASGFGVCCVFLYSENGATITQNCSYIQNPGYPGTVSNGGQLAYNIQKCSNDVCFLRLDFELFSIQGTAATTEENGGQCVDTFDVTINTGQNIPQICGENGGQHIYVDIGNRASDTATLNFNLNGDRSNRIFDIKVTQIPCRSRSRPPEGCLQYHTGLTGRMETFNYQDDNDNHLANQEYSVCIRQESGFCCVEYTPCTNMNSFSLDPVTDGDIDTAQTDSACTQDYVSIAASTATCSSVQEQANIASRFCGTFLSSQNGATESLPVCDCTAPFEIGIYTDGNTDMGDMVAGNTIPSRGACLTWKHIPCNSC